MMRRRRSPPSIPNLHTSSALLLLLVLTILIKISLISSFVVIPSRSSYYTVHKTTPQHVTTTTTALYTTTTTTTTNTHHTNDNNSSAPHPHPSSKTTTNTITSYHLLSLPPLVPTRLSPTLRSLWRWKDYALGDGRDYFIPRPRAITALQNLILKNRRPPPPSEDDDESSNAAVTTTTIKECSVLSNCARLDIVLVAQRDERRRDRDDDDDDDDDDSAPSSDESSSSLACRRVVARVLASQLSSRSSDDASSLLNGLSSLLDLPNVIADDGTTTTTGSTDASTIYDIENELVAMDGLSDVCRHLCLVAGGLAERPSRPGREVVFRPFSSRDAHVMLQLKRTAELAKGSRIRTILDSALRSGKACRDVNCVPEIASLRGYDGAGRYSREAPRELSLAAAEAAIEQAIVPSVHDCLSKIKAMDASEAVSHLRRMAKDMVAARGIDWDDSSDETGRMVRTIIHRPTVDLREGRDIDYDEVVRRINDCLVS